MGEPVISQTVLRAPNPPESGEVVHAAVEVLRNAADHPTLTVEDRRTIQLTTAHIEEAVRDDAARDHLQRELAALRSEDPTAFRHLLRYVNNTSPQSALAAALRAEEQARAAQPQDRFTAHRRTPGGELVARSRPDPGAPGDVLDFRRPLVVSDQGSMSATEDVLATSPQYRNNTIAALREAGQLIKQARDVVLARDGGVILRAELDAAQRRIDTTLSEMLNPTPSYDNVVSTIATARAALMRARDAATATRTLFDTAIGNLDRLGTRRPMPAALLSRAGIFLASFRRQSGQVLEGFLDQPVSDWNLAEVMSGRLRPDDAMRTVLLQNVALYSVHRDLEAGLLTPADFAPLNPRGPAPTSWEQISMHDLWYLAQRRLQKGGYDWAAETRGMLADRTLAPLTVRRPGEKYPVRLEPRLISFWNSSPEAVLDPAFAARTLGRMDVMRVALDSANRISGAQNEAERLVLEHRAALDLASTFYVGSAGGHGKRPLPANPALMRAALMRVTGTDRHFELVPDRATANQRLAGDENARLEEALGTDGSVRLYVTRPFRDTRELMHMLQRRLAAGDLANLDPQILERVRAVVGNDAESPGAALLACEASEDGSSTGSQRWWREKGGLFIGAAAELYAGSGGQIFGWGWKALRWVRTISGHNNSCPMPSRDQPLRPLIIRDRGSMV